MKKILRNILFPLFIIGMIFSYMPLNSRAASLNVFIDANNSVAVGSEFKVTVRFEADAQVMIQAELNYDSSTVTYLRSDASGINNIGGKILIVPLDYKTSFSLTFYFKMEREASAKFTANVIECLSSDNTSFGTPYADKTVNGMNPTPVPVTPAPTQKPTPTPTPFVPTIDPSATPSTPLEFRDKDGEMRFIANKIPESAVIPEGFELTPYSFRNNDIFVVKNAHNILMVYATNVVGQNGRFYIYNEKTDALSLYMAYAYAGNSYTFLEPSSALPNGYNPTTVKIGDIEGIAAYTIPDTRYADFLLVYAFNKTNAPTFYLYDTVEGTLQRCTDIDLLTSGTASETQAPGPSVKTPVPTVSALPAADIGDGGINTRTLTMIIIGLCFAAAVVVVVVIIVKNHKINQSYDLAEAEEAQDNEETATLPEVSVEPAKRTPVPEENESRENNESDDDDLHLNDHFPR